MNDDVRLLREYATTRSEAAFAEVVRRYVDFVYSSARRQVGEANLAEDVTQAVFIVLAKRAGSLPADRPISTWLLKTTSYCAANARRARGRRTNHERKAAEMASKKDPTEQQWESLSPLLDEGLSSLRGADRDALLMKFFEKKSLQQVGEALGVSEDAAQKRVTRAVDKLRDFFHARGATTLSASALTTLLAAESMKSAPAGLATSVSAAAGASAAGTSAALAKGALIFMTAKKITIAAVAVIILILGIGTIAMTTHRPSAPIVQATTSTPRASTRAKASAPVTFPDGTTVDVIALRDSKVPTEWWALDGSPVPEPDIRAKFGITMTYSTARSLDLIVKLTGSGLDRKGITIWGDLPLRTATQSTGNATERLMKFIVPVPYDTPSGDLRIGLAGGKWESELSLPCANGEEPPQGSTGADVQFLGTSEDDKGRMQVRLLQIQPDGLPVDREFIVIAGGRELRPGVGVSLGDVYTRTFKCSRSEAEKIIVRSRPFEWIDLKDVAFQPKPASATTQSAL